MHIISEWLHSRIRDSKVVRGWCWYSLESVGLEQCEDCLIVSYLCIVDDLCRMCYISISTCIISRSIGIGLIDTGWNGECDAYDNDRSIIGSELLCSVV